MVSINFLSYKIEMIVFSVASVYPIYYKIQ